MDCPQDRSYTKEHEWFQSEGEAGRIGITAFAEQQLGDIVFVELPKVGRHLAANESFGVVESVKSVSDLYAPVAGEVLEVNETLLQKPELVNEDPYGQGWILRLRPDNAQDATGLLSAQAYQQLSEGGA